MSDRAAKESSQAGDILALFRRGAESAKELIRENERLWNRVSELEDEQKSAQEATIVHRLHELEEENRQFAERYVQIEEENAQLVNLYVASCQLHSTRELNEVLSIITEILVNLVGAEKLAVYALDEQTNSLCALVVEGAELGECPKYELGSGVVGTAALSGAVAFLPDGDGNDPERPLVCIPLRIRDRVLGVIVIYSLCEQKEAFTPRDHELFTLLGEHAATALLTAQLYLQSKRKLDLFRGLCELLVK